MPPPRVRLQVGAIAAEGEIDTASEIDAHVDPEDLRDVLRAYHDACAAVVKRFEGHVAQYLGDGILVYFGFPVAHEDDAERGVRAALAIQSALAGLNAERGPDAVGAQSKDLSFIDTLVGCCDGAF